MSNSPCKAWLIAYRKQVGAKPEEKIDKRYKGAFGYLAPNNQYYKADCGYCAEVKYLETIYGKDDPESEDKSQP